MNSSKRDCLKMLPPFYWGGLLESSGFGHDRTTRCTNQVILTTLLDRGSIKATHDGVMAHLIRMHHSTVSFTPTSLGGHLKS